jgi:streptogramin lyase
VLAVVIAAVFGVVAPGGAVVKQGHVTEFSAGITAGTYLEAITAGPDGNVWFTENVGGRIGRITPTGEIAVFSLSPVDFGDGTLYGASPSGIITGPDGNLWFTEGVGIGRITPKGKVTEFSAGISKETKSITAGPDGNLWFTEVDEQGNGQIGRIGSGPSPKPRGRRDPTLPAACPRSRR